MGTVRSHKLIDLRFDARQFIAVCRCGWKSPHMSSAGLAHSALDIHAEDEVADASERRTIIRGS